MFSFLNPLRLFSSNTSSNMASQESPLIKKGKRDELVSNWPRFGLKSFFDYYPFMRMLGYAGSTLAPLSIKKIISGVTGETSEYKLQRLENKARKMVGRTEASAFLGWSLFSFFREKKMLKQQLRETVAAEFGINPARVGLIDLRRSANPLIESMVDKFFSRNIVRFGTDIWFWVNLEFGILMKAIGVTAERSVFVKKTAFENLAETIYEARTLNATDANELSKDMIRALQSSFRDHKVRPLSAEVVELHRPLFEKMANAVLEHRIGLAEVVYVVGGVMLKPGDQEASMRNLKNILQNGLRGIAEAKYDVENISFSEKTTDIKKEPIVPEKIKTPRKKTTAEVVAAGAREFFPQAGDDIAAAPAR